MNQDAGALLKSRADVAAAILIPVALIATIELHLLPALFAGLLVYVLVHVLAPRVFGLQDRPALARIVVVALLVAIVIALAAVLIGGAMALFHSDSGNLAALLQKMAEIIDGARATLPAWVQDALPADSMTLKDDVVSWLREHAAELKKAGGEVGRALAYALIGMVIGALVAVREVGPAHAAGPLAHALTRSIALVADAFRRVVLAQVRISALNTVLSAIYLARGLMLVAGY